MTTRILRALIGSSAFGALAGCQGDSAVRPGVQVVEPTASAAKNERTLAIELTMPARNDGGMIFTVEGPNIVDVAPASGFDIVTSGVESHGRTTITALVAGPLQNGVIAWLTVRGVNSGQPYDVAITQVAAGAADGYVQRSDPGAYQLSVRR
jgi:hypothetical protein